jgi:hypothetical protein
MTVNLRVAASQKFVDTSKFPPTNGRVSVLSADASPRRAQIGSRDSGYGVSSRVAGRRGGICAVQQCLLATRRSAAGGVAGRKIAEATASSLQASVLPQFQLGGVSSHRAGAAWLAGIVGGGVGFAGRGDGKAASGARGNCVARLFGAFLFWSLFVVEERFVLGRRRMF